MTRENLATTICASGYTNKVRPSSSFTNELKLKQLPAYGYADQNASRYDQDHLIPLELGGAPRDPKNLWPEPKRVLRLDDIDVGSAVKDRYEVFLHRAVCDGTLSLTSAQKRIATNWIAYWEAAGRP